MGGLGNPNEGAAGAEAGKEVRETWDGGTIKRFDQQRGFGFIAPAKGGPDVFLHISVLKEFDPNLDTLPDNQWVSYVAKETHKGMRATKVKVVQG